MALPKQTRRQNMPNGTAHAPYNFVPLPQQAVTVEGEMPAHDRYTGFSGWIDCDLETLSPLYVRGMLSENNYKDYAKTEVAFDDLPPAIQQERARFFAVDERVTIPGSSLRGMVRTLVEIAGFGKLQAVNDRRLIFRAVGDPSSLGQYYRTQVLGPNKATHPDNHFDYPSVQLHGGYLKQNGHGWAIQPSMMHNGESIVHVEYVEAQTVKILPSSQQNHIQKTFDVYVTPAQRKRWQKGFRGSGELILDAAVVPQGGIQRRASGSTCPTGMVEATLVVSGHMGGDHKKHWHCAIYSPDPQAQQIPIPEEMWQVYEEDRDATRGFPTRKLQKDGDALFYLLDAKGKLVFFGPTQMFRLPYGKSARDFIPNNLRNEQAFDLGEALFGYVGKGKDKKEARAGRVFFEDARTVDGQGDVMLGNDIITPQILGTPKPSTFQHYLVQPDDAANNRLSLKHYASETPSQTVIRGHKLFWHRGNVPVEKFKYPHAPESNERKQAKKQLTGIRPVKSGVKFTSRIRFENLSLIELGALLWVLDLPAGHAHKLGMAKPLGLGSVRINPTLHLHDRTSRYQTLFAGDGWQLGASQPTTITQAKKAFEDHMLARIQDADFDAGRSASFADVARIRELLCLLRLPTNENARFDQTKYMTIEPENEYKRRPILPLPSVIIGMPASLPATPVATGSQVANATTAEVMPDPKTLQRGNGTLERKQTRDGEMIYVKDGDLRLEVRRERLKADYNTLPGNGKPVTYQYDEVSGKRRVWIVQRTLQTKGLS